MRQYPLIPVFSHRSSSQALLSSYDNSYFYLSSESKASKYDCEGLRSLSSAQQATRISPKPLLRRTNQLALHARYPPNPPPPKSPRPSRRAPVGILSRKRAFARDPRHLPSRVLGELVPAQHNGAQRERARCPSRVHH